MLLDGSLLSEEVLPIVKRAYRRRQRPCRRLECETCGEGVNDGREVSVGGRTLCRAARTVSTKRRLKRRHAEVGL